ncbi:MAG: site-specific integrase [Clostridia bacterium]|nr:site-specific integrase [Clostridia bacterium]
MPRQKLTKRPDGYFRVKYHGKDFYGKTQAEAMKRRDEYKQKEQMGLSHDLQGITFLDYAMNWLSVYRTDCSQALQKQYAGMIRFAADHLRKKFICDINANDLQALFNKLTVYSSSYVSKFASIMNGIFRNAVSNGALLRNPMDGVVRPKCKKTEGHRCFEPWERELIRSTWEEHDFGLAAMVMLYTGFRRGEMLHLDIDRDVDFEKKTITVRGAVSFSEGNQPAITKGKTDSAIRTVPLLPPLEEVLKGRHGLVCPKENGTIMSQSSFARKYDSYISFLETKLNGTCKRWYGKTKEHKAILEAGGELPAWREVTIRCHDFRVEFCARAYYAQVPLKTLQSWMGHADAQMILEIYTKLDKEQERTDAAKMVDYLGNIDSHPAGTEASAQSA